MLFFQIVVSAYVFFNFVLLVLAFRVRSIKKIKNEPKVAVLVPFRNEKQNLEELLPVLEKLNYPTDRLILVFGDDESEDGSAEVIEQFLIHYRNGTLIFIKGYESRQKAKARVLEKMLKEVEADYYVVIDADVRPHKKCIYAMLNDMTPTTGLVSGVTIPKPKGFWGLYDSFDWFWNLVLLKSANQLGQAYTALGNNMMISKEAYDKIGGFEAMDFSVTEDFALNEHFIKNGYRPKFVWHSEACADTDGVNGLRAFLNQRIRWVQGVKHTSLAIRMLLLVLIVEVPLVLVAWLYIPELTPVVFLWLLLKLKVLLLRSMKIGRPKALIGFLFHGVLVPIVSLVLLIYSFSQQRIEWKDRLYN